MRFVISRVAIFSALFLFLGLIGSAHAVEVSLVGPGMATLLPGEQVTIDLTIRNPNGDLVAGLGFSAHDYDASVANFAEGQAVSSYLNDCLNPATCVGGLDNISAGALEVSGFGDFGPRVQFALSASLAGTTNTGDLNLGLDGTAGTPQFSLTFEAIAPGITTILLDTSYQGDAVVLRDPVRTVEGVGTSFTIRVIPEPGTALLMGLGLVGLARSGRARA